MEVHDAEWASLGFVNTEICNRSITAKVFVSKVGSVQDWERLSALQGHTRRNLRPY